jgi:hypothetical protein
MVFHHPQASMVLAHMIHQVVQRDHGMSIRPSSFSAQPQTKHVHWLNCVRKKQSVAPSTPQSPSGPSPVAATAAGVPALVNTTSSTNKSANNTTKKVYNRQQRSKASTSSSLSQADRDAATKRKHNESEHRRRALIGEKFDELRDQLRCPRRDRDSVLAAAITRLRFLEERVHELEERERARALENGVPRFVASSALPEFSGQRPLSARHASSLSSSASSSTSPASTSSSSSSKRRYTPTNGNPGGDNDIDMESPSNRSNNNKDKEQWSKKVKVESLISAASRPTRNKTANSNLTMNEAETMAAASVALLATSSSSSSAISSSSTSASPPASPMHSKLEIDTSSIASSPSARTPVAFVAAATNATLVGSFPHLHAPVAVPVPSMASLASLPIAAPGVSPPTIASPHPHAPQVAGSYGSSIGPNGEIGFVSATAGTSMSTNQPGSAPTIGDIQLPSISLPLPVSSLAPSSLAGSYPFAALAPSSMIPPSQPLPLPLPSSSSNVSNIGGVDATQLLSLAAALNVTPSQLLQLFMTASSSSSPPIAPPSAPLPPPPPPPPPPSMLPLQSIWPSVGTPPLAYHPLMAYGIPPPQSFPSYPPPGSVESLFQLLAPHSFGMLPSLSGIIPPSLQSHVNVIPSYSSTPTAGSMPQMMQSQLRPPPPVVAPSSQVSLPSITNPSSTSISSDWQYQPLPSSNATAYATMTLKIVNCSDEFVRLVGHTRDTLCHRDISLLQLIMPEHVPLVTNLLHQLALLPAAAANISSQHDQTRELSISIKNQYGIATPPLRFAFSLLHQLGQYGIHSAKQKKITLYLLSSCYVYCFFCFNRWYFDAYPWLFNSVDNTNNRITLSTSEQASAQWNDNNNINIIIITCINVIGWKQSKRQ